MLTEHDIPYAAPNAVAEIEKSHVLMVITPNDDAQRAYDLFVPKGWAHTSDFGPAPVDPFQGYPIGAFIGSAISGSPLIAVTVEKVPYEIPIDTWALRWFARDGFSVVAARWVAGEFGVYFDVVGTRLLKGRHEVQRSSVRLKNNEVFMVHTSCDRAFWDEAKESLWIAHATFAFAESGPARAERRETVVLTNPDFKVAYPASWLAEPVQIPPDVSAVHLRLADDSGQQLLAYLLVRAVGRAAGEAMPAFVDLTDQALEKLHKSGVTLTSALTPLTPQDDPLATGVEGYVGGSVGAGVLSGSKICVRLGFIARPELVASCMLLSPSEQADPLLALRAQRAFEIVRDTFATPEAQET